MRAEGRSCLLPYSLQKEVLFCSPLLVPGSFLTDPLEPSYPILKLFWVTKEICEME